jgi:general secretion pathway protein I
MKFRMTRRKDQRGFTLLETVVALTIAAITLPVLLQTFSRGTKAHSLVENKTTAFYLLRLKMAEIEMLEVLEPGSEEGEFGTGSRFTWASEVAETDTEGLYEIIVTVIWEERGRERSIELATYIADKTIEQQQQQQQGQQGQQQGQPMGM